MEDNRKGTWEDVTGECKAVIKCQGGSYWVEIQHGPATNVRLTLSPKFTPWAVHDGKFSDGVYRDYRVLDNGGGLETGGFRIEHFIPDPEPVIAYKAVRVDEDGVMRSILCGATDVNYMSDGRQLDYEIGQNVDGGQYGVFCFSTVERVKDAYITGYMARSRRPLAILKVEACGKPIDTSELKGITTNHDIISYPSVKVLSVAWEEEKKEEWVDVTDKCEAIFRPNLGYVVVRHEGTAVLSLGSKPFVEKFNTEGRYRITFEEGGCGGSFKVEKRND